MVIVPVVHSSRRGVNSSLAAAMAMAVAYARRDVDGEMYRDLLESAMGERAVAFLHGIQIAHSLFPDIPMPTYGALDLHIGDVLTLARLAVRRRAHLVPVLYVDLGRLDAERRLRGMAAVTLRELDASGVVDPAVVGAYWDPGAPPGRESFEPDEPSLAAAFEQCAIVGRLPPGP
jgi:hypothetical protein